MILQKKGGYKSLDGLKRLQNNDKPVAFGRKVQF